MSATLEDLLTALDLGYFEVGEAFDGLADEHVWQRPAPGLLSVGELAGHIAYWEAVRFGGAQKREDGSTDLSTCQVRSPLVDPRFAYYSKTVETTPSEEHLAMTGAEVLAEMRRVHGEAVTLLRASDPDLAGEAPFWFAQSNYAGLLRYVAFHIAYHTGQMYSVRHLLGENPPDN